MPMVRDDLLRLMMNTFGVNRRDFDFCEHPDLFCVVPVQGRDGLFVLRVCCWACAQKLKEAG